MLGIDPMLRHLPRDLSVGRDVQALAGDSGQIQYAGGVRWISVTLPGMREVHKISTES